MATNALLPIDRNDPRLTIAGELLWEALVVRLRMTPITPPIWAEDEQVDEPEDPQEPDWVPPDQAEDPGSPMAREDVWRASVRAAARHRFGMAKTD